MLYRITASFSPSAEMGNASGKKKTFKVRHEARKRRQGYEEHDPNTKDENDYTQLDTNKIHYENLQELGNRQDEDDCTHQDTNKTHYENLQELRIRQDEGGCTQDETNKIHYMYENIQKLRIRQDLYVVAMDIGTSSCGYAISAYDDYTRDPLEISTFGWPSKSDGFLHHKNLSVVLLDEAGTYHSFGFDAEYYYVNSLSDEERKQWFYFQNFKMKLYSNDVARDLQLYDVNGKPESALKIFSFTIKALKNHLLTKLRLYISNVEDNDIHWIITVPAIWNEKAKQFMREASGQAGISDKKLSIALEPEAAALYCRHLPVEKLKGQNTNERKTFNPGSHYLIVDIGGGTVDITSHIIHPNGALQETMAASGGDWGSLAVNEQFLQFFEDLTVKGLFKEMRALYPEDYIIFLSTFENKKRLFSPADNKVTIFLPQSMRNLIEDKLGTSLEQHIQDTQRTSDIKCQRDKVFIYRQTFINILESTINKMIKHIMSLFTEHKLQVNSIVLVGGFAECELVRTMFETTFPDKKVIVPEDAVLAVLKGAVLFGRNPNVFNARVSRFTYGICTNKTFKENEHHLDKKVTIQGKAMATDIFDIHIRANEMIYTGVERRAFKYSLSKEGQSQLDLKIYATKEICPKYITDSEVIYMGTLSIDVPAPVKNVIYEENSVDVPMTLVCSSKNKFFFVSFLLDGTELEIIVTDPDSKQNASAKFDFLG